MDFTAFSFGSFSVYWYGLTVCAALVAGLAITKLSTLLYSENFEPVVEMTVWGILCGVIAARAVYVLQHFSDYSGNILSVFAVWQGGVSIYGALVGFLSAAVFYMKARKMPVLRWLDIVVPAIVFGITILQAANFMLQFSIGAPVGPDVPNDHRPAEYIEYRYRPSGFEGYQYFQPVAFYMGLAHLALFVIIYFLSILNKRFRFLSSGTIFLFSAFFMALFRFCFGFMYLGMNEAVFLNCGQWIALFVMCVCTAAYIFKRFHFSRKASGYN